MRAVTPPFSDRDGTRNRYCTLSPVRLVSTTSWLVPRPSATCLPLNRTVRGPHPAMVPSSVAYVSYTTWTWKLQVAADFRVNVREPPGGIELSFRRSSSQVLSSGREANASIMVCVVRFWIVTLLTGDGAAGRDGRVDWACAPTQARRAAAKDSAVRARMFTLHRDRPHASQAAGEWLAAADTTQTRRRPLAPPEVRSPYGTAP